MTFNKSAGAVMALAMMSGAAGSAAAAAPPVTAFARLAAIQSAAISPDGQGVAMISGSPERRQLSISTIDQPDAKVLELGAVRASDVRWAGDGYLLVRVTSYEKPIWAKYAYNFTRDLIFTRDGKIKGWMLNNSAETGQMVSGPQIYRIVGGDKPFALVGGLDGGGVNVATNDTKFKQSHDDTHPAVFKVDVATGRGSVVQRDPAADWAFDGKGEARAKLISTSTGLVLSARGKGQSAWKVIANSADGIGLNGYSDGEDAVYWSQEDGAGGLPRLRKTTFPGGETTLLSDVAPSANLTLDPYTGAPIEASGAGGAAKWFDPTLQAASNSLTRAFKGRSVELVNWSQDHARFIVRVTSQSAPASWYLFDPARKSVSILGDEYPELKDTPLGTKTFFTYAASDGLTVPAYLHMPPGGKDKNLPLIVLPHGGPASRDDDGFDWWAQFLASRGYVVLQPQFRGSDGFGAKLRDAGAREWGGKMQTDLIDGVDYLAKQGTIDRKRVCIIGASYGGYAAMQGMAAHGDVYRCGVAVNGVSDIGQMIVQENRYFDHGDENEREDWRSKQLQYFGSGRGDIADASPALHADKVKGPMLLIYSAQDTTVSPEQSKEMIQRLAAAGNTPAVVELAGDDHYLRNSASRTQMLTAIDNFLAKNLPANP